MFIREDWSLFRNLPTLCQKAGVHQDLLAPLCLKELADNALDAGAKCSVRKLPAQLINGRYLEVFAITDDGPGIPGTDDEIADLVSIRRPLTSSKLLRLPTRGALGNGLRVVAGAVLATGGWLRVGTRGRWLTLQPQDDGTTKVVNRETHIGSGTRVEIAFGPALRLTNATWMADMAVAMRGESAYKGLSSAWWYDSDSFYELLQAAGELPLCDLLDYLREADGLDSETSMVSMPCRDMTREDADDLLGKLRAAKTAPAPTKLGVVGKDTFTHQGYKKVAVTFTRQPARGAHAAVIPAVIEAWVTKLDAGKEPAATVYVNRTPITTMVSSQMDTGRKGRQAIMGCGINHWFDTGRTPMHIRINVTSPYMPITNDGKAPDLRPMLNDLFKAVETAARAAKRATSAPRGTSKKQATYYELRQAIHNASSNGKHRFNIRNLYYAMRPLLAKTWGITELEYNTFCGDVADWENEHGEIKGMYRDARGVLYTPHTHETIELGTLAVENYRRPEWTFRRILYIEKRGFFPLLIDEGWPDRWDCALLTSQGQATAAVKDLFDLLGDTDEPIEFFCIHDADAYGTVIYESLVEETRRRGARRVTVHNLGLEPWEGMRMGLEMETFEAKSKRAPVARYVRDRDGDWENWLQTHRYELNAIGSGSSEGFLSWLDSKMQAFGAEKVIPPIEVIRQQYLDNARAEIRRRKIAEAIEALGIDDEVNAAVGSLEARLDDRRLRDNVMDELEQRHRAGQSWRSPVKDQAVEDAAKAAG